MIKMRNAYYCNLKIFLLYLVVYGHWIENQIQHSYKTYLVILSRKFVHQIFSKYFYFLRIKNTHTKTV